MGVVLASRPHGPDQLGWTPGAPVAVLGSIAAQPSITREVERGGFPEETLGAFLWCVGKVDDPIRFAIAVVIDEDANVARPRDDNPAARVDGDAEDIVGQPAVGEFCD